MAACSTTDSASDCQMTTAQPGIAELADRQLERPDHGLGARH